MGKLAKMAGSRRLTGPVTVTRKDGSSTTYPDEQAAEAACGSLGLFHNRGAFYERGCVSRGRTVVEIQPPPPPAAPAPTKSKKRPSSGDEE